MNPFTREYYEDGKRTGLSCYENYRWLEAQTVPACKKIAEYMGFRRGDSVVDQGCAKGFYVRAMRMLGYRAFGFDISEYAIQNCDPEVKEYVSNEFPKRAFDWALGKDLLEHIPLPELTQMVGMLNDKITKGMLFIVPLADSCGGGYVRKEDEQDSTHIIRWTLDGWISFLEDHAPDFNVNGSFHIHGIKPAAAQVRHSCGFLTLVRP